MYLPHQKMLLDFAVVLTGLVLAGSTGLGFMGLTGLVLVLAALAVVLVAVGTFLLLAGVWLH